MKAQALDLQARSTEPELLDLGVSEAETARSLADIRFVNRWLGGRRALLRAVLPYLKPGARLLDVGCGSADLPDVLRSLHRLARGALVVNDLRRARVPHLFARLVFPLVFRSPVSVHDGLVSIRRGFTSEDLHEAFARAGIPRVRVVRRLPYRLVAVAEA